jgi:hypothetical protein
MEFRRDLVRNEPLATGLYDALLDIMRKIRWDGHSPVKEPPPQMRVIF